MMSTPNGQGTVRSPLRAERARVGRDAVLGRLTQALLRGDHAAAREIYYRDIVPDHRYSNKEVDRLSMRVGAVDEGDAFNARRTDL